MTVNEILDELKANGSDATKKVLAKHGAREPFFGVKVEYLKKIVKRVKVNYELALALYATGISDAMYLAGLIADDAKMTKKDLQRWADEAYWYMLSCYTVPWVAAGSKHGHEMALKWIDAKKPNVVAAGWTTLGCLVSMKPDDELDMTELKKLLLRVEKTIHGQPGRLPWAINSFVISVGGYVKELSDLAIKTADRIGKVEVDMGDTECKVPDVKTYIKKMKDRGSLGKKRKTVKC